jgi:N4-gp56 family major capsid protein
MALTNFARLQPEAKIVWSKDVWQEATDQSFLASKFAGTSENSMIHKITEMTQTEKGTRCIIPLVADLVEDGVISDNEREGNEEEIMAYFEDIEVDLISHSVASKGKLADQKSVIQFREWAKSRLANWLGNRMDQLGFLTLAGVSYAFMCDGSARPANSPFPNLAFASHVSAPSAARHLNWNGTELTPGDTTVIANTFIPNYRMIVDLVSYAKDHYVKPLNANGREHYILLVKPGTLAALKKDDDYQRAVVTGLPRDNKNPWFTGGTVTIDGAVIHEHRLVYSTQKAASGSKWGAGGLVNGTRTLLCGAQALGMATIGDPSWVEKKFQYDSRGGINVDRMFGLVKPKFMSAYDKTVEDFGVIACDHYLQ